MLEKMVTMKKIIKDLWLVKVLTGVVETEIFSSWPNKKTLVEQSDVCDLLMFSINYL